MRRAAGQGEGWRRPAYVSRSTLARELSMSDSTVDEMVRRGVLAREKGWMAALFGIA